MTAIKLTSGLLSFAFALVLAAPVRAVEPDAPEALISRTDATRLLLLSKLESKGKAASLTKDERASFAAYYGKDGSLLWVDETGANNRAQTVAPVLARGDEWGLEPKEFRLASGQGFSPDAATPAEWLAETELTNSLAVYTYAKHAQAGRVNPQIFGDFVDFSPEAPAPAAVLQGLKSASSVTGFLEGFHPKHPQFLALKAKLRDSNSSRAAASEPQFAPIPSGPTLKPGNSHRNIVLIRERLNVEAEADAYGERRTDYYDRDLADAVKTFQRQNGLTANGVINSATRRALNGEDEDRSSADQKSVLVNMERWRWLPRDLGQTHVWVSIPEFNFRFYKRGQQIHEERIVVGKVQNKTPMFRDEIEFVVLNPYWNVPESIIAQEILPILRRNPGYLEKNNLEVYYQGRRGQLSAYDTDWSYLDPSKLQIRQQPGGPNVLGQVKFLFPNRHSVYMHDTSSKNLFSQNVRAFSHGCMRVRNPLKYAELLLEDQGIGPAQIERMLAQRGEQSITLQRKVPIYITYFTNWVQPDGSIRTVKDIYGHDPKLWMALQRQPVPVEVATSSPEDGGSSSRSSSREYREPPRQRRRPQNDFFLFDW